MQWWQDESIAEAQRVRAERDSRYGNIVDEVESDVRWAGKIGEMCCDRWPTTQGVTDEWILEDVAGRPEFVIGETTGGMKSVKRNVPMRTRSNYARWVDEPLQNCIRTEFEERGWSISDLARASDFAPSLMSRWIMGRKPSAPSLQRVAKAVGVSEDKLLTLAGCRQPVPTDEAPRRAGIIALLRQVELTDERHGFLRSA